MTRHVDMIIIHCSATLPDWMEGHTSGDKVEEIRKWHMNKGWSDIGYAYVIDRNGAVVHGRDLDKDGDVDDEIGAHTKGKNAHSIGICLLGGHGSRADQEFRDNFTPEQEEALQILIETLQKKFPEATVHGHNEFANKACPGFNAKTWWLGRRRGGPAQAKPSAEDLINKIRELLDHLARFS